MDETDLSENMMASWPLNLKTIQSIYSNLKLKGDVLVDSGVIYKISHMCEDKQKKKKNCLTDIERITIITL